jgi:hypothetical protein
LLCVNVLIAHNSSIVKWLSLLEAIPDIGTL